MQMMPSSSAKSDSIHDQALQDMARRSAVSGREHCHGDVARATSVPERDRDTTSGRLRALFVCTAGSPGGAERSLELLLRYLACTGTDVALICPATAIPGDRLDDVRVFRLWTCALEPVRRPTVLMALSLASRWLCVTFGTALAILRTRAKVVHANDTKAMLAVMLPAWLMRRPLVWHVRDLVQLGKLGCTCARLADAVIAVSHAVADSLERQGIPRDKIHVVRNGVAPVPMDADVAQVRNATRDRLGIPQHAFAYLNVGQYVPWRRQDASCAASIALRTNPDAWFLLVGSDRPDRGACKRTLEDLAVDLGIRARTIFLTWQSDIGPLFAASDVLVHTTDREPFGRVIIEAMQAGLPVIAANGGGPAEIIEDGVSGTLLPAPDPGSFASAMVDLWHRPAVRRCYAAAGCQRVQEAFTADRVASQIRNVYARVLAERRTP